MKKVAINKAYSLGYNLDSNVQGNLRFSKKILDNEYYLRVAFGRIENIGGRTGFIVECWSRDFMKEPIFNSPVSTDADKMSDAIKQAAGL